MVIKPDLEAIAQSSNTDLDFDAVCIKLNFRRMKLFLKPGSCLECGPASGTMTTHLLSVFGQLDVVDGSRAYCEGIRTRFGHKVGVTQALFEEFEPKRKYDNIILSRVLEHIEHPVAFLSRLREWLLPQGRVHTVVPNAESLHRRLGVAMGLLEDVRSFTERDKKHGHYRVYDRQTLIRHVMAAGFVIENVEGHLLKPFSHAQMATLNSELIDALFSVGFQLPDYCAQVYLVATDKG